MQRLTVLTFFLIILGVPIVSMVIPNETISELENRELATSPSISVESYFDKSFMEETNAYLSDHIAFREELVEIKTRIDLMLGKSEINSVYICDDRLIENVAQPNEMIMASNMEAINNFAEHYRDEISTTIMLVPTASQYYKDALPMFAEPIDQLEIISEFYDNLNPYINKVDVYTEMNSVAKTEDIFYKTDHHWTTMGAYVGYTSLSTSLSYTAQSVNMFNIQHVTNDFLGTLYSKTLYGEEFKDRIDLYHYGSRNVITEVMKFQGKTSQSYQSIFFDEYLSTSDKYAVFLGGNDAVTKIKTSVNNGKRLLIFKDSYANSLMQFMPLHYEEIVLVDLRYLNSPLDEYINISNYDSVLFLYNVSGFTQESSLAKLNYSLGIG